MSKLFANFSEWYRDQSIIVKCLVTVGGGSVGALMGIVAAPAVGAIASAAGLGLGAGFLSGAAASASGLAALGGGAVVTGGLGMAGGTAVVASAAAIAGAGAATYAGCQSDSAGTIVSEIRKRASNQTTDPQNYTFE